MKAKYFLVFTRTIEYIIKYFKWIVVFSIVLILLSGIFRVQSNEVAVILRFGSFAGQTPESQIKKPGLHFALPFFIDEVIKIPAQTMHERDVTTHYVPGGGHLPISVGRNGYLLTGDNNIVLLRAKVIYQIQNPVQYTINNSDSGRVIDGVVSGVLTSLVTQMDIDTILTVGRAQLSSSVLFYSQSLLDELKIGITIAAIELTEIIPPREIVPFFEEVRTAAIYKETLIRQGREFETTSILNAQAEARAYRQTAISEQNFRLAEARDRMAEFNGLYEQYRINPNLIISGVFRERISAVIAKSGGSIIIPDNSNPPVILLP